MLDHNVLQIHTPIAENQLGENTNCWFDQNPKKIKRKMERQMGNTRSIKEMRTYINVEICI